MEGEAPSPLAPATYTLVDLDENVKNVHIPALGREYDVKDLSKRPDILELLHSQGWPNVKKTR